MLFSGAVHLVDSEGRRSCSLQAAKSVHRRCLSDNSLIALRLTRQMKLVEAGRESMEDHTAAVRKRLHGYVKRTSNVNQNCGGSFINIIIITHADDSRGSKAFIGVCLCVCVCVCVCVYDKTKMAETTITKLATGIVHHELGQRSQGHKVQKH